MKLKVLSFLALVFCSISSLFAQMQNPVHWSYSVSPVQSNGEVTVTFTATIDDGWHMYDVEEPADGPVPTSFKYSTLQNAEPKGNVVSKSKPISKFEQAFGMTLSFYEENVTFQQTFKVKDVSSDVVIEGNVEYMCCDDQMCLPPTKNKFSLTAKGIEKVADNQSVNSASNEVAPEKKKIIDNAKVEELPVQKQLLENKDSVAISLVGDSVQTVNNAESFSLTPYGEGIDGNSSLWAIFLSGLLGGFIAVLTPCVWPIIPMTVTFFLKRNADKAKGRQQALFYGLSIVVIYVVLGLLVTAIYSANTLNKMSTDAVFNIFLFLLLVVFACSFFGGFEIMLPASWSSKIDEKAEKVSGVLGVLLMACTLVIVSFSCTGPIIGTLLVSVSTQGNILGPAVGMMGFALALAIPFSFFAFFPSVLGNLPRSGNWLNMVKVLLGFFELAFSLKFLSVADQVYRWGLLSRPTFIAIWIVLFVLAGVYLLGKLKLPHDTDMPHVSVPRLLMAMGSFSFAVYLLPGLFGAPLNIISAFAPPISVSDASFYQNKGAEAKSHDYDEALKIAAQENMPLLIDFTGYGCVNCRKMETAVWTNPQVADLMNNKCVLVSLYTDDRTPLAKPEKVKEENGEETLLETKGEKWSYLQRSMFKANAQPYYVMISPNGEKVYEHYFKFSEDASKFCEFIKDGIRFLK